MGWTAVVTILGFYDSGFLAHEVRILRLFDSAFSPEGAALASPGQRPGLNTIAWQSRGVNFNSDDQLQFRAKHEYTMLDAWAYDTQLQNNRTSCGEDTALAIGAAPRSCVALCGGTRSIADSAGRRQRTPKSS